MTALDERATSLTTDAFPLIQRVALYVTLSCNLRCKHCCIEGSPAGGHLQQPHRRHLFEAIGRLGKPVDLTGGEPLLDPDLPSLARELHVAGATIGSVFTNGTLVGRRQAQIAALGALTPSLRFFVSLDGDPAAHDTLRGPGSFAAALEGASLLKTMGFPVFVNTMLHAAVHEDSLVRLYRTVADRGFDRWRLDSPFNAGAWTTHRDDHEPDDGFRIRLLADVVSRWASDGMPFELEAGHILKYLGGTVYFLDSYRLDDPVCPCRTLPVWPNGDVSWCQDLSEPEHIVGNLLRDSLSDVYARYAPYKTRSIGEVARSNGVCGQCRWSPTAGQGAASARWATAAGSTTRTRAPARCTRTAPTSRLPRRCVAAWRHTPPPDRSPTPST